MNNNNKGHRVSNEVKTDILRRVREEGIPVSQAAQEHGLHESTIYHWLGAGAQGSPSWSEFTRLEKQNKELFEVVGELTVKLSQSQKKN